MAKLTKTVEFTRLKAGAVVGNNPLRTETVYGIMDKACLKPGSRARLISAPLTQGADIRFIETSPIVRIEVNSEFTIIHTESGSTYQIKDAGDDNDGEQRSI